MSNSSMMDTFVSGLGALGVIYFLLWGLLYLIYGKTMVVRLWQRLGPGIMIFAFLGVLAGKLGHMGVSDLITKGLIPLGGLAIMTTNLIIVAHGIASASSEQAQGIAQINTAVAEMDKVVQQNAATAEEAAAATESICGQADRMRERISELSAMVFDARRERGGMTETHVISQHKGQQQT